MEIIEEDVGFKSRTGSSRGYFKQNGEIVAIAHPTSASASALAAERGVKARLNSTMKESYKNPNHKQALMAYHPNAIRNRLPVKFDGAAIPGKRFCSPRNNHTYE